MSPKERKEIDTTTYTGRFAERLRMLREKKKLSVEELSTRSGIHVQTLYHWERASRSPSIEQFPQLAKALGVKTRNLLPED